MQATAGGRRGLNGNDRVAAAIGRSAGGGHQTTGLLGVYAVKNFLTAGQGRIRMSQEGPSLERAALSLGATNWTTFRRIVLPLIMPGVVSGWVIAFITSFDELTMSIFIASPSTTTLPVRIFLHIEDTIDPLVTAVSAALIYITMIAIFILDRAIGLEKLFVGKGRA